VKHYTSGIKSKDLIIGSGKLAEKGKVVVVHVRGFLRRGEECCNSNDTGHPSRIDLSRRDAIPGLQTGIEGMLVGGRRELIVSPHLAYGAVGIPGRIPPNAVIRFEVELLGVREVGEVHADDFAPGKHLSVYHPGEAARNLARWQFGVTEGASAGVRITRPLPNKSWRRAPAKGIEVKLDQTEISEIIREAVELPIKHPQECLLNADLWSDTSEKTNNITRTCAADELCVTITIWERGQVIANYALPETSAILTGSRFYPIIFNALEPYLG
jgi:hypothetical protein